MIEIKINFYANLQKEFGEKQDIFLKEPIRLIQLFDYFYHKNGKLAKSYFLLDESLKNKFNILIDGRNIHALDELNTIIKKKCEISFFPLIGGGFLEDNSKTINHY